MDSKQNKEGNFELEPIEGQPGWYWDHKTGRTISEEELGTHLDGDFELDDTENEYHPYEADEEEEFYPDDSQGAANNYQRGSAGPEEPGQAGEEGTPKEPRTDGIDEGSETGGKPGSDTGTGDTSDLLNNLPTDRMGAAGEKIEDAKKAVKLAKDIGEAIETEGASLLDVRKDIEMAKEAKELSDKYAKDAIKRQVVIALVAFFIVFGVPVLLISLAFMGYGNESASGLTTMPPGVPQPANVQEYCKYVGSITNTEAKRIYGSTEAEVVAQLVSIDFPEVGAVRVHRLAAPCFIAAGQEMVRNGALNNYDIRSFGTFSWRCAKNTDYTCKSTLSNHSFGIAVDINPGTNPYKSDQLITDFPPGLITAFKNYGFGWGGDWKSSKDAMHFEWLGRPSTQ